MKKETKKLVNLAIVLFIAIAFIAVAQIEKDSELTDFLDSIEGFELLATESFDKEEVLSRGYPVMLDIGGAKCTACQEMAPVLADLNKELQGRAIVKFVDYQEYPKLATQFDFKVIPTQKFYDEYGILYATHEGQITKEEALNIFNEMGYDF